MDEEIEPPPSGGENNFESFERQQEITEDEDFQAREVLRERISLAIRYIERTNPKATQDPIWHELNRVYRAVREDYVSYVDVRAVLDSQIPLYTNGFSYYLRPMAPESSSQLRRRLRKKPSLMNLVEKNIELSDDPVVIRTS